MPRRLLLAACCAGLVAAGCDRGGARQAPAAVAGTVTLASIPDPVSPPQPSAPPGLGLHATPAAGVQEFVFGERGGGVAFVVEEEKKFRVVHNGRPGRPFAAVGDLVLSADGLRHAYGAFADGAWRVVVDGREGPAFRAVDDPAFSPDGAHVLYEAMAGDRWHLAVNAERNAGTPMRYLQKEFNRDSSRIAYIDDVMEPDGVEQGRLFVSDRSFTAPRLVARSVTSMLPSPDRSRLAATERSGGQQRVVLLPFDRPDQVQRGPLYEAVDNLAFSPDGASLAYVARRAGRTLVVLDGREQPLPPGAAVISGLVVRPDRRAAAAIVALGDAVGLHEFFQASPAVAATYQEAEGPAYGGGSRVAAFAARRGSHWFAVVGGREGPPFDRVVSPALSPDGRRLVYRARKAGRRFVVVADLNGKTIRRHTDHERVFPFHFTADGRSVAYGVKDGQRLDWVVEAL